MLPSGFLAWMNKKNPDAAFTDDEDLEAFFNDEEDGGELLDYYIGLYNDSAERDKRDEQLKADRRSADKLAGPENLILLDREDYYSDDPYIFYDEEFGGFDDEDFGADGWDDDDFDDDNDDNDDLDFSNKDHETDGDADGTHYVEKVDVNGDGDTDILEICTDGDGEAEIKATDADSADEQEMIDEHEKLDEVRDTYRNIANTLSDHRF